MCLAKEYARNRDNCFCQRDSGVLSTLHDFWLAKGGRLLVSGGSLDKWTRQRVNHQVY